MNALHETLLAHGLRPKSPPVPDGQWHRCPTESHPKRQNGAWKWAADGEVAWFMDYAKDGAPLTWRPERETDAGPSRPIDLAAMRRREAEAKARRRRASAEAAAFYEGCAPLIGGHAYLQAHGLDMIGCRGLRVDRHGWLVVPMKIAGRLASVQRINPDGEKRFWPGAPTSGAFYPIARAGSTLTVLCEGLATGLAVYASVPTASVVVGFTAGNLPAVASSLPKRGLMAVAADNDHGTEARTGRNPGVVYASEAARILGCAVALPDGIQGTDFCDLRMERRAAGQLYGARRRAGEMARDADAEVRGAILRAARFVAVAG